MRSLVLLAMLITLPGTAFAGSFVSLQGNDVDAGSIEAIGTPAPKVVKPEPVRPALAPGHEMIRIADVDGKQKIFRTEAWLGGSPVTYVTTATAFDLAALKQRGIDVASTREQLLSPPTLVASTPKADDEVAGIDRVDTTGSVSRKLPPLDAANLKLRPALGDS